ncbi:MAG: hypothetical protein EOO37_02050 [Cytophagaceae bacterium]|nr:MAG: hypothetical protein EOO37_02050 [Cytophagaceae bacterium]
MEASLPLNQHMNALTANILLSLTLYPLQAFCQVGLESWQRPVVRHGPTSALPDTLAITGKIVAVTNGYCGYCCWGGTVQIRLTQPIGDYSSRYAFVVTACLSKADTSRIVCVKASKLKQQEKECYYKNISNAIDSQAAPLLQAIPFYKLSEQETHKLELDENRRK